MDETDMCPMLLERGRDSIAAGQPKTLPSSACDSICMNDSLRDPFDECKEGAQDQLVGDDRTQNVKQNHEQTQRPA
jgi:hypothetical protein